MPIENNEREINHPRFLKQALCVVPNNGKILRHYLKDANIDQFYSCEMLFVEFEKKGKQYRTTIPSRVRK